jgi:hypothetical protein
LQSRTNMASIRPLSPSTENYGGYSSHGSEKSLPSNTLSPRSTIVDSADVNTVAAFEGQKSETYLLRERGATIRANTLLENTLQPIHKAPKAQAPKTARQAATERYETRKKEKYEAKKIIMEIKKNNPPPGITKKLVVEKPLELRATSTRKSKKSEEEDDCAETIQEMKCTLTREIEKEATSKALELVELVKENCADKFMIV